MDANTIYENIIIPLAKKYVEHNAVRGLTGIARDNDARDYFIAVADALQITDNFLAAHEVMHFVIAIKTRGYAAIEAIIR